MLTTPIRPQLQHRSSATIVASLTVCLASAGLSLAASGSSSEPAPSIATALDFALQADGNATVAALRKLNPTLLKPVDRELRTCMLGRLERGAVPSSAVDDSVVAQILSRYQEYWRRSLFKEQSAVSIENGLLDALNTIMQQTGNTSAATLSELEPRLEAMLMAHGYHSLLGVTSPLRELMLWRSETPATYNVNLPGGPQTVVVIFMDDFASLGWAGFATCDRTHTGGWSNPDRLYAVRSSYDLRSEDFRVSYLAHEGQHFADFSRFPKLIAQTDLEYRAKLTELSLANTTLSALLDAFSANESDDVNIPHSYANRRVIVNMCKTIRATCRKPIEWRRFPRTALNHAAATLLIEDTRRLTKFYR